jgi:hypothetical protein
MTSIDEIKSNFAYYVRQYPALKIHVDSLPNTIDKNKLLLSLISDEVIAEEAREIAQCEEYRTMQIGHRNITPEMQLAIYNTSQKIKPIFDDIERKLSLAINDKLMSIIRRDVLRKNKLYVENELYESCTDVITNALANIDLYDICNDLSEI